MVSRALSDYSEWYYCLRGGLFRRRCYVQIHITTRCLNRCPGCYYRLRNQGRLCPQELTAAEIAGMVDAWLRAAERHQMPITVDLTGGDPLLHPAFWDVLRYLQHCGVDFGVKANPHLLDENTVLRLARLGLKRFQLSLDGIDQTHDVLRGSQGLFRTTIEAMRLLVSAQIAPIVRYTLPRDNSDDLIRLQHLLHAQAIPCSLSVTPLVDFVNHSNTLSAHDLLPIYREHVRVFAEHLALGTRYRVFYKDHLFFPLLHQMGVLSSQFVRACVRGGLSLRCTMFEHVYIVDADRTLRLCQKLPEAVLGCVSDYDFATLLGDRTGRYPFGVCVSAECQRCHYEQQCFGCPARKKAAQETSCPLFAPKHGH